MKALTLLPFVIAAALAGCGEKTAPPPPPAASAPSPTAQPAPAPAAEAPATSAISTASAGDLVKGEQVYSASCLSCHGSGVMGAPKLNDKAAWEPRIAAGKEVVYANAINGFKMMPAKGGNPSLKDDEVNAAVDFMISTVN